MLASAVGYEAAVTGTFIQKMSKILITASMFLARMDFSDAQKKKKHDDFYSVFQRTICFEYLKSELETVAMKNSESLAHVWMFCQLRVCCAFCTQSSWVSF